MTVWGRWRVWVVAACVLTGGGRLVTGRVAEAPEPPAIGIATAQDRSAIVRFVATTGADLTYTVTAEPGGHSAEGASSPIVVDGLTNGTIYRFRVSARSTAGAGAWSEPSNPVTPARLTPTPLDLGITWVLPSWDRATGASPSEYTSMVTRLRSEIGEGARARIGLSVFVQLTMSNWSVDTTNRTAMRAALASAIAPVDAALSRARTMGVPLGISLITAIRERVDPVQTAASAEDRRNVQWYQDHQAATGWITYSAYARKLQRVQEAYVREFGRMLVERMVASPDIFVAVTGDGETEMAYTRFRDVVVPADPSERGWADYSPFAVAEFRDWLRGEGLYGAGQPLDGQAYADHARYRGDASPADDTNGDGHTLNGDFGTSFSSWRLRYFDWSLDDAETTGAVPTTGFSVVDDGAGRFDAPRPPGAAVLTETGAYWLAFRQFRERMIHRYNRNFARWITESTDPDLGGIPFERWYSAQIPTDVLFGDPAPDLGVRLLTSASPHWTADIWPYGGMGVTGYNVNLATNPPGGPAGGLGGNGPYARTTPHVIPRVAARSARWAIVEWNPSDPWSSEPDIYRLDVALVRQYRPALLMPFKINTTHYRVFDSGFVTALQELMTAVGGAAAWTPSVTWTPGAVAAGVGIGAAQLNARANVSGRFSYTPAAGTVLAQGVHTIAVTFTPDDADYRVVTSTATLTVTAPPALTVAPSTPLHFAAVRSGSTVLHVSAPQEVVVGFSPNLPVTWTVSSPHPWLQVTPTSGQGAAIVRVSIANVDGALSHGGVVSGGLTITASHASGTSSPRQIPVVVTMHADGAADAPFGVVDTPLQGAIDVRGAIAVTGWALDDVAVSSVDIYRSCLDFEDVPLTSPCQTVIGRRLVYVGTAAFLPGARPDVEAALVGVPNARAAGWGYLLLTSMLPDVERSRAYGGQGTITLTVIASDVEGHQTVLGRTADPDGLDYATPTTITLDNDRIVRPFGAIDTPGQGATVSGVLNNFGWALTPDANATRGDGDDIVIPTDGSTMTVFIDGLPRAQVAYNQCRGSVGNPVPALAFCNDDVSSIFGAVSPQAVGTLRVANPTRYRNLDAGSAAIGAYTFDTTTLANGLHTIAWSVTDSAGRTEGIGSRFFNVVNVTSGIVSGVVSAETMPDVLDADAALRARPAAVRGPSWALDFLRPRTDGVWARTGFDLTAPWSALEPDGQGQLMVEIPAGGRVELWLGSAADRGALVVGATLRALPPGSTLAGQTFAWTPPVGYVGSYRLSFGGDRWRTDVVVVVR